MTLAVLNRDQTCLHRNDCSKLLGRLAEPRPSGLVDLIFPKSPHFDFITLGRHEMGFGGREGIFQNSVNILNTTSVRLNQQALLQTARQQITHDWWNNQRQNFDLCISQTVIDEAEAGDADAAKRRISFLKTLPLLDLTEAVHDVAKAIMNSALLPKKATRDAVHIAVSSVHGIDILLTWNCQHIANAAITKELGAIVAECGYEMSILCTPEELLED